MQPNNKQTLKSTSGSSEAQWSVAAAAGGPAAAAVVAAAVAAAAAAAATAAPKWVSFKIVKLQNV